MTDYDELIKALRICSSELNCGDCPLLYRDSCSSDELMADAAAAIEALQAELEKKRTADCWGCKCEKLEPKRGEWIETKYHTWECSVCGKNPTTGMGYVQTRKALYNYCPNCGAKMTEVQDDKTGV